MTRKQRITRKCTNVTLVRIGECVVKIWNDPNGLDDRSMVIEVESEHPVEVKVRRKKT